MDTYPYIQNVIMKGLKYIEQLFNKHLGWFFTNARKQNTKRGFS